MKSKKKTATRMPPKKAAKKFIPKTRARVGFGGGGKTASPTNPY
jgi:hypothetical protein